MLSEESLFLNGGDRSRPQSVSEERGFLGDRVELRPRDRPSTCLVVDDPFALVVRARAVAGQQSRDGEAEDDTEHDETAPIAATVGVQDSAARRPSRR